MEFLAAGAGLSLLVVAALASDASGGSLVMAVRISGRARERRCGSKLAERLKTVDWWVAMAGPVNFTSDWALFTALYR